MLLAGRARAAPTTSSQPSSPHWSRICLVAWVSSGTVAYSQRVGSLMGGAYPAVRPCLASMHGWRPHAKRRGRPVGWPSRLTKARLHFVTGKGGTGKSTVAAALALALAAGGRKVLLVEVEGRQGIAQLFDVPPLPYKELKIATAERRRSGERAGDRHRGGVPGIPRHVLQPRARRAGDAAHRRDRVRDHDRARSARRAAHRQDQGDRRPRRQGQAAGLRRRRGRLPRRPGASPGSST